MAAAFFGNLWNQVLAFLRAPGVNIRTAGRPTSRNRASSFHLMWEVPSGEAIREAAVTIEVTSPPAVDELYFWALQATFANGTTRHGGAHLGIQWNRKFPGHGAVNWGGYESQARGGAILQGTESPLPSTPNDRNTRDYPWQPHRRYRLRISPTPDRPGWWRGTITDIETGNATVVRDLDGGGEQLTGLMVWSEVFARCDDPSVAVRWSDFEYVTESGGVGSPPAVRANYQRFSAGGCSNTNVEREPGGVLQNTNSDRTTPQDARIEV